MILYKYCGPDRVDVLDSGMIGLTRPRSFNDPFEFSPDVSGTLKGIEMARETWERTKEWVVLCLAESADHPLMWGHYAAGLNGFVIGLDAHKLFAAPSSHRKFEKVHVREEAAQQAHPRRLY